MTRRFEGKVALVTGGSSGIGRASALAFASEGAKVVIADIAEEGGAATVNQIREAGGDARFVRADVSQASDVEALVREVVAAYGRLDCAHNNAGILMKHGPLIDIEEKDWDLLIDINLKGAWLCMKYEIRQMLTQGGGAIVNTSSIAGLVGFPGSSAYNASKHGVLGLTKTAAVEYASAKIRVNAICPGFVDTPMAASVLHNEPEIAAQLKALHPIGRIATPQEIAQAVLWLASDAASFTVGSALVIDGGFVAQ